MNGSKDVFADMRETQAELWPSADAVAMIGEGFYP